MSNKTVLVVDDEKGFLQIVQIILQRAGYEPVLAHNVTEAMAKVEQHKPAAIILDDDMPGTSGGEMSLRLKQDSRTSHIAIIMFSANERLQNPDYIARIKADAAVKKPCMPADILNALDNSLKKMHVGV